MHTERIICHSVLKEPQNSNSLTGRHWGFSRSSSLLSTTPVNVASVQFPLVKCMTTATKVKAMASTVVTLDMFAMLIFSSVLPAAATDVYRTKMKLSQMSLQRPVVLESLIAAFAATMQRT